ncbi:hypothetical protein D3C87_1815050 [compost metagenome]
MFADNISLSRIRSGDLLYLFLQVHYGSAISHHDFLSYPHPKIGVFLENIFEHGTVTPLEGCPFCLFLYLEKMKKERRKSIKIIKIQHMKNSYKKETVI